MRISLKELLSQFNENKMKSITMNLRVKINFCNFSENNMKSRKDEQNFRGLDKVRK